MNDDLLYQQPLRALLDKMAEGRVTSEALVDCALQRIEIYDPGPSGLRAILTVNPGARDEARQRDRDRSNGRAPGPLHGIPVVVKDNINMAGLATSAGSAALLGYMPAEDATLVRRLKKAGAVILAKTNLHELAAGLTTVGSAGGQTRNPFDAARTPGGSSGGSAAAVAASFVPLGWGTDTCGSIRIPAAHCGLYGLRPTQGLPPMGGIVPLSRSQDVVGPLARTVHDLAVGLDITMGKEMLAATGNAQGDLSGAFLRSLGQASVEGLRIGVLESFFTRSSRGARSTERVVLRALERLADSGAEIVEVDDSGLKAMLRETGLIVHEFKFDLADFLSREPGAPVGSLGEIIASGLHHRALDARFRIRNRPTRRDSDAAQRVHQRRAHLRSFVEDLMVRHEVGVLAYPTSSLPAPRIGEPPYGSNAELSAHTGMPAICVPAGLNMEALPVGLELLGPPLSDDRLVEIAAVHQRVMPRPLSAQTVPALIGGRPPSPLEWHVQGTRGPFKAEVRMELDERLQTLSWSWTTGDIAEVAGGPPAGNPTLGLFLRLGTNSRIGPVITRLDEPGRTEGSGARRLDAAEQRWITRGVAEVVWTTAGSPPEQLRLPLTRAGRTGSAQ